MYAYDTKFSDIGNPNRRSEYNPEAISNLYRANNWSVLPCFASQPGIRPTLFCCILYLCTSILWTLNRSLFKNCLKMCNGLYQYVVTILSNQQENTKINKFSISKLFLLKKILFLVKNYEPRRLFEYKWHNTAHLTSSKLTLMIVIIS